MTIASRSSGLIWIGVLAVLTAAGCGGRADLAPVLNAGGPTCRNGTRPQVVLEVVNQGRRASRATTTSLVFPAFEVRLPTRPLLPGDRHRLSTTLPGECRPDSCSFSVRVDAKDEVRESNEDNNAGRASCRVPQP